MIEWCFIQATLKRRGASRWHVIKAKVVQFCDLSQYFDQDYRRTRYLAQAFKERQTMQELDKQIFLNIDHDLCAVTMIKTNELLVYPRPSQYKHMNAWRLFIQILAPSLGMQIRCAGCADLKQVHSNFNYSFSFWHFLIVQVIAEN